ncbi:signal recognition particle receptor subunit beta-like [Hyalella azteca]|uniref:Signal recognition particle receptor subunit beta n=1 Tax=Hyalella azteca TaxID=294128 RepID=A0A8B7PGE0_HYAAZ|nr:signal recognition particle receptor subunit beta-like [Hyalella azteca]
MASKLEMKKSRISLADTYRSLLARISSDQIFYAQIAITVIFGLLILYLLTRRVVRSVGGRGRSIVLVGNCEAGKTALLYTLTRGQTPITVTSFKDNEDLYNTGNKSVRVVDVPGHERVRSNAFDKHKSDARAIVFLLDSTSLGSQIKDVAEQLFTVLSDSVVQGNRCPVAVLCNKQDQDLAKSATIIERALQKEFDVLRETSSSRLASISNDGNQRPSKPLGVTGKPFAFSQVTYNPVTFMETSVVEDKSLANLKRWIEAVA